MPWVWVAVVLILWTATVCAVIALCISVRQVDARLGRGRKGLRYVRKVEPQPGTKANAE